MVKQERIYFESTFYKIDLNLSTQSLTFTHKYMITYPHWHAYIGTHKNRNKWELKHTDILKYTLTNTQNYHPHT